LKTSYDRFFYCTANRIQNIERKYHAKSYVYLRTFIVELMSNRKGNTLNRRGLKPKAKVVAADESNLPVAISNNDIITGEEVANKSLSMMKRKYALEYAYCRFKLKLSEFESHNRALEESGLDGDLWDWPRCQSDRKVSIKIEDSRLSFYREATRMRFGVACEKLTHGYERMLDVILERIGAEGFKPDFSSKGDGRNYVSALKDIGKEIREWTKEKKPSAKSVAENHSIKIENKDGGSTILGFDQAAYAAMHRKHLAEREKQGDSN